MGFISKQWLKGNKQRNRSHIPVPVIISAQKEDYLESKVTLTTTWLNGLDEEEYKSVDLTKEEVEQALPYFLHESNLANLPVGDPKRIAIIESLSKLSDAELTQLLADIRAAKAEPEPDGLNVAEFAAELGLPIQLLVDQLKAAGVGKKRESYLVTEKDKAQLLAHLRQAHEAPATANGGHDPKISTEATPEAEKKFLENAVSLGKLTRAQMLLEVRQGKSEVNFNELRQLDMDIEKCEKELEGMK